MYAGNACLGRGCCVGLSLFKRKRSKARDGVPCCCLVDLVFGLFLGSIFRLGLQTSILVSASCLVSVLVFILGTITIQP
jgi:hypothetical protein